MKWAESIGSIQDYVSFSKEYTQKYEINLNMVNATRAPFSLSSTHNCSSIFHPGCYSYDILDESQMQHVAYIFDCITNTIFVIHKMRNLFVPIKKILFKTEDVRDNSVLKLFVQMEDAMEKLIPFINHNKREALFMFLTCDIIHIKS